MSTLYVTQQDTVVRKTDERLKVTQKTETLLDVPMLKVSQVVVFGRVTVTAPTLQALLEHHIPVCYLSAHGRYVGRIEPALSKMLCYAAPNTVPLLMRSARWPWRGRWSVAS